MLNELYSRFDDMTTAMQIYKVETIGDCYMAAAGVILKHADHAERMVRFAMGMQVRARRCMHLAVCVHVALPRSAVRQGLILRRT